MRQSSIKNIAFGLIVLVAVLSVSRITYSNNDSTPFEVVTVPSLESIVVDRDRNIKQFKNLLIKPKDKYHRFSNNTVDLKAARGEYESFQIVVQAPEDLYLSNVNVVVSDLRSADKKVIASNNITLYREHYIHVTPTKNSTTANPTKGEGWYPDALIPFVDPDTNQDLTGAKFDAVPFDLSSDRQQPIWVDVFVPRDAAPGEYQGTYTVQSDRGEKTGTIKLNVWDFELPVKPTLDSLFDVWEYRGRNVAEVFAKHKVMPGKHVEPEQQQELINQWGLNSVRLPIWSGANYKTCKMKPAPQVKELKEFSKLYDDSLLKYIFSADEIDECSDLIKPLKQWGKNIHQAGIKHLVVMKPRPELYDAIDIWVVEPKMYRESKAQIAQVIKEGDKVWFYPGYHTNYGPQWKIDTQPINFRISQGFIAQSLGMSGFLAARADGWTDDPWHQPPVYTYRDREYAGDGMFVYPGAEVGIDGVMPSIRLKWVRDGVEDYEYIAMLKRLGDEEWALKTSRTAAKDWRNWTKDPDKLADVRIKLANRIEELTRNQNQSSKSNNNQTVKP